ncbi:hypothetical protein [Nostoc sp.]|uniref:hypothetical protein n=1 Tax=Nostoc sp. TaxID=1180 RepID=UPI002FF6A331
MRFYGYGKTHNADIPSRFHLNSYQHYATPDTATGNNTFYGDAGNDTIYGGNGNDTFAFNSYKEGVDRLYDFKATNKIIRVSAAGFGGGLSIGSLKTSQFTIRTSATAIA